MATVKDICPKCSSPMGDIQETPSGRKLRRCSTGSWNPETKKTEGCPFVLWIPIEPQSLDEKCPKCSSPLILQVTRFGKKMKKCSTGGWDKEKRQPTGCDYVEWINGTTEPLDEICPECGQKLVLYTPNSGKKMKKCPSSGWDRENRQPTGCRYVYWVKPGEYLQSTGEEFLPPDPSA